MIDCGRLYLKLMREKSIPETMELLKSGSAKMLNEDFGENLDPEIMYNWFYTRLSSTEEKDMLFLAYLKKSQKLVGYYSVSAINRINMSAAISIFIHDKYQAMGYGFMGASGLSDFCFKELNLVKVYLLIRNDNNSLPNRSQGQLYRKIPMGNNKYFSYYYWEFLRP